MKLHQDYFGLLVYRLLGYLSFSPPLTNTNFLNSRTGNDNKATASPSSNFVPISEALDDTNSYRNESPTVLQFSAIFLQENCKFQK